MVANAVSRINTKWRDAADKIGEEGAARIGLERNEVLKTLNLHRNNIGDKGAAAIGEALRGNAVLTELKSASIAMAEVPTRPLESQRSPRPSRSTGC